MHISVHLTKLHPMPVLIPRGRWLWGAGERQSRQSKASPGSAVQSQPSNGCNVAVLTVSKPRVAQQGEHLASPPLQCTHSATWAFHSPLHFFLLPNRPVLRWCWNGLSGSCALPVSVHFAFKVSKTSCSFLKCKPVPPLKTVKWFNDSIEVASKVDKNNASEIFLHVLVI